MFLKDKLGFDVLTNYGDLRAVKLSHAEDHVRDVDGVADGAVVDVKKILALHLESHRRALLITDNVVKVRMAWGGDGMTLERGLGLAGVSLFQMGLIIESLNDIRTPSPQSAKRIIPVASGRCKENDGDGRQLVRALDAQFVAKETETITSGYRIPVCSSTTAATSTSAEQIEYRVFTVDGVKYLLDIWVVQDGKLLGISYGMPNVQTRYRPCLHNRNCVKGVRLTGLPIKRQTFEDLCREVASGDRVWGTGRRNPDIRSIATDRILILPLHMRLRLINHWTRFLYEYVESCADDLRFGMTGAVENLRGELEGAHSYSDATPGTGHKRKREEDGVEAEVEPGENSGDDDDTQWLAAVQKENPVMMLVRAIGATQPSIGDFNGDTCQRIAEAGHLFGELVGLSDERFGGLVTRALTNLNKILSLINAVCVLPESSHAALATHIGEYDAAVAVLKSDYGYDDGTMYDHKLCVHLREQFHQTRMSHGRLSDSSFESRNKRHKRDNKLVSSRQIRDGTASLSVLQKQSLEVLPAVSEHAVLKHNRSTRSDAKETKRSDILCAMHLVGGNGR